MPGRYRDANWNCSFRDVPGKKPWQRYARISAASTPLSFPPTHQAYLPIYRREGRRFSSRWKREKERKNESERTRERETKEGMRRNRKCEAPSRRVLAAIPSPSPVRRPGEQKQPSSASTLNLLPLTYVLALQTTSFQTIFLICSRYLRNSPPRPPTRRRVLKAGEVE